MATTAVLDLAAFAEKRSGIPSAHVKFGFKQMFLIVVGALLALGLVRTATDFPWFAKPEAPIKAVRIPAGEVQRVAAISVDDRSQLVAEGLDAVERNATIPLAHVKRGEMKGFVVPLNSVAGMTALKCLTQAIYYEAANEPVQGRRAVAQVVLNRVRHPLYPNSVCGVVYQGADRLTGCQFSFTCDGSLLRRPAARPWHEAEEIARQALGGYVEPSVGTATFYHADYVLPKWAFQFDKLVQEGRHIFYSFQGNWGRAGSFYEGYAGVERIPSLNFAALRDRLAQRAQEDHANQFVPGLTVTPLVSDRHAEADVGGRIDMTKTWRLSDPDDSAAGSRLQSLLASQHGTPSPSQAQTTQ